MPQRNVSQPEDEQSERFKQAALDIGADQSTDALDRVMGKLDLKKKPEPKETDDGKSS